MIVTPCTVTVLSAQVSGQLPPCSAARSTITEHGFIVLTISSLTSTGAGRPGISAVVMTKSCFLIVSAISAACLAWWAARGGGAGPAAGGARGGAAAGAAAGGPP